MRSLRRLLALAALGVAVRALLRRSTPHPAVTVGYDDGSSVEPPPGSPAERELVGIAAVLVRAA